MVKNRICWLSLIWLCLLIVPTQAQVIYQYESALCPFAVPVGQITECGYLIVPEDYSHPGTRQISLAVAIFRHPNGNPEPDPIIYLEGGPGGSAIKFADLGFPSRYQPMFATNRDIIIFDQRGVGLSSPALNCPEYAEAQIELFDLEYNGAAITRLESDALIRDSLMACGENLASQYDLSQYNSAVNARDVENLRLGLGYNKVNLWGISYGTKLALTVMRDYPNSVRSVILDSTYPLEVNLYTDTPVSWSRALDTVFDACAADAACNAAYPHLRQIFLDTINQLNQNPVTITANHPIAGQRYTNIVIDGTMLQRLVFSLLYDTSVIPYLPYMIQQANSGNVQIFSVGIGRLLVLQDVLSYGMYYAVQCQEELPFTENDAAILGAYATQSNLYSAFTENVGTDLFDICASFQAGSPLPRANNPVLSNIPTLIMAGRFDPITPPAWGQQVQQNLTQSFYVEFPTIAHGASSDHACPQSITIAFFLAPTIAPDVTCIDAMQLQFQGANSELLDSAPMM